MHRLILFFSRRQYLGNVGRAGVKPWGGGFRSVQIGLDWTKKDVTFTRLMRRSRLYDLGKEGGMLEIIAYGILGGMILATSLVLWWFVRLVE
jgi:hypothetical protein